MINRSSEWCATAVDELIVALEAAPDAVVPAYPGWSVRDLTVHVVRIYTVAAAALRTGVLARPEVVLPVTGTSSPEALAAALRDALRRALHALDECPHDHIWGAGATRRPSFWRRRLVREAVLHRWDAEQAAAVPRPPDGVVALELIDEFLDTDIVRAVGQPGHGRSGVLGIWAGERRWTVDLADGSVRTEDDSPDQVGATIRGDPASVWLWLVRREPLPDAIHIDEIDGTAASFAELIAGFNRPDGSSPHHG